MAHLRQPKPDFGLDRFLKRVPPASQKYRCEQTRHIYHRQVQILALADVWGVSPPLPKFTATSGQGTYKTVKCRAWHWPSGNSPLITSRCSLFARKWPPQFALHPWTIDTYICKYLYIYIEQKNVIACAPMAHCTQPHIVGALFQLERGGTERRFYLQRCFYQGLLLDGPT